MREGSRTYIVYDGRAELGDTDEASVCVACDSLKEAQSYVREHFPDGVIYSYKTDDDGFLVDKRREANATNKR